MLLGEGRMITTAVLTDTHGGGGGGNWRVSEEATMGQMPIGGVRGMVIYFSHGHRTG
jgi:hypothetical protein